MNKHIVKHIVGLRVNDALYPSKSRLTNKRTVKHTGGGGGGGGGEIGVLLLQNWTHDDDDYGLIREAIGENYH